MPTCPGGEIYCRCSEFNLEQRTNQRDSGCTYAIDALGEVLTVVLHAFVNVKFAELSLEPRGALTPVSVVRQGYAATVVEARKRRASSPVIFTQTAIKTFQTETSANSGTNFLQFSE